MNKYSSFYRILSSYCYLLISTSIAFTFKLDGDFSQAQQGSVRWSGLGVRSLLGRIPIPGRLRWTIKTAVQIQYMTFINSWQFWPHSQTKTVSGLHRNSHAYFTPPTRQDCQRCELNWQQYKKLFSSHSPQYISDNSCKLETGHRDKTKLSSQRISRQDKTVLSCCQLSSHHWHGQDSLVLSVSVVWNRH